MFCFIWWISKIIKNRNIMGQPFLTLTFLPFLANKQTNKLATGEPNIYIYIDGAYRTALLLNSVLSCNYLITISLIV